jgi:catechol O-methyltransferase
MYHPGNPQYSEYMRASPSIKGETCRPFEGCLRDGNISLGNPALVYRSALHGGLQPTGLLVSQPFLNTSTSCDRT